MTDARPYKTWFKDIMLDNGVAPNVVDYPAFPGTYYKVS